jgi:GNAT superfamily N-acetyltransferase
MPPLIREVERNDADGIQAAVNIMRIAYLSEAELFDMTPESCPTHPAFVTVRQVKTLFGSKRVHLFGLYPEEGDAMAGILLLRYLPKRVCEMIRLCVLPEYRGIGYGYDLFSFIQEQALAHHCEVLTASIAKDNEPVLTWCLAQGFTLKSTLRISKLPYVIGYLERALNHKSGVAAPSHNE